MNTSSAEYLPMLLQVIVAVGFVVLVLVLTHLIGPKRKSEIKLQPFESGIESVGNARLPFSIKYFLIAILFVLFDVEVIFFYPYATNIRAMGMEGFFAVLVFVGFLLLGFLYLWKKKAFKWE
jgi:NADH-quinone oxidoreductase subunit A